MPTQAEIVYQLTTQWSEGDGDPRSWQGSVVTYTILDLTPEANLFVPELIGGQPITPDQLGFATEAFELWDDLIAISLNGTPSPSANITFGYSTTTQDGGTYASPTIQDLDGSDLMIRQNIWMSSGWSELMSGNLGYGMRGLEVFLHEIGHSLGLSHPGNYDASDDVPPAYADDAEFPTDTRQFTVMSYFNAGEYDPGIDRYGIKIPTGGDTYVEYFTFVSTPLLYDIVAIQAKYGADYTTRATDTVYGFNSTAGRAAFDFTINMNPIVAIWDGGGIDTLDVSGYVPGGFENFNQIIDLRSGKYSSIGALTGNVVIAYNCVIENAIGGGGNDNIQGNAVGNRMAGGMGADTILGIEGNDLLIGGAGNDELFGGAGDDTLEGGDGGDTLYGGSGYDLASYSSEAGDDFFIRIKPINAPKDGIWEVTGAAEGTGDSLAGIEGFVFGEGNERIILANSAGGRLITINGAGGDDTLIGSRGPEVLIGGSGYDTFDPLSGVFTVFGGQLDVASGNWIENLLDGDQLLLDYSAAIDGFTFLLSSILGLGTWLGSDGSTARGIARITFNGSEFGDRVVGGLSHDRLVGNGGNDSLTGRDGGDSLLGMAGSDFILGEASNDVLYGGTENDTLYGGIGDDRIFGGPGADHLNGGDGNDNIYSGGGNDLLVFGDLGNDSLYGSIEADVLYGGVGDDFFRGSDGNDSLYGEAGNDQILGGEGDDYIDPGVGRETLDGGAGNNYLYMNRGATFSGVSFYLNGTAGSDGTVSQNFGRMFYVASSGNDTVSGSAGDDRIDGNDGQDNLKGLGGSDNLYGGLGNDALDGGLGADGLYGGEGNDVITTGGGGDFLVIGGLGNDTLNGSVDAESLYGGDGNDSLSGEDGADFLDGGTGNDTINGGGGDDTINPGTGIAILNGGSGTDYLFIDRSTTSLGLNFFLNGVAGSDGSTSVGIESMKYFAGSGIDWVAGSSGDDWVAGFDGNDRLEGGGGNDRLDGGNGNDLLIGGAGVDILYGGEGDDIIETGGGLDKQNFGGNGNDTIIGSGDIDWLYGERDADNLSGKGGDDALYGGDGNDTMAGGSGVNFLDGGNESDVFVFIRQASTDSIIGFDTDPLGGQDRLDVSALGYADFGSMLAAGVTIAAGLTGTVITFGAGAPVVTLISTVLSTIDGSDFLF